MGILTLHFVPRGTVADIYIERERERERGRERENLIHIYPPPCP